MLRIRSWPVAVRENLPLIATTLVWTVAWLLVSRLFGLPVVSNDGIGRYLDRILRYFLTNLLPILLLLIPLGHLLKGGRAEDFTKRAFWAGIVARYSTPRVLGGVLLVFVCLPVFYATFRDWKTAIPSFVPFYLDPALERADRWLHGGRHPWEWLHPLLGAPDRTHLIDGLYVFWFEAQLAIVLWMSFSRLRWLRARFFITYILMYYVMGVIAAGAFSSAGPVYFARVVADVTADPFQPLMLYLHGLNESSLVYAVNVQESLWGAYSGVRDGPIQGISAFPSLHVAGALLFVFVGFHVHWALGGAFLALLAATLAGSVYLGWHYALDGYVGIAMLWGLWALSAPLTRAFFAWAGLDAPEDPSAPPSFRAGEELTVDPVVLNLVAERSRAQIE